MQSTLETLQAEIPKLDKATLDQVTADFKAYIVTKEQELSRLQAQIKEKSAAAAQSLVGGAGQGADALKAEVDTLSAQLDALKQEIAGLHEKLQLYVADLAKRPA